MNAAVPEPLPGGSRFRYKRAMLRRLYDWTMRLAESPRAVPALVGISFAESSFFPVPPDVILVPMALARPDKARYYALVCTIASVAGGLLGYAIGALLYDTLGAWLIQAYGYGDRMDDFRHAYEEWGAWLILIKGITPIPFKLVTIASGFAGYDILLFVLFSFIARGARFFIVAELIRHYGEPMRDFIDRRFNLLSIVAVVLLIGGFVAARYAI